MTLLPNNAPKEKRPSPASVLAKLYEEATEKGYATVVDFSKLLKSHGFEEIRTVITWLADQPDHVRLKPSSWFTYKFKWMKIEASSNLADYPIGPDVSRCRKRIEIEGGDPIPDTFIQHCLDHYQAFLEYLRTSEDGKILYERFDPAFEFAVKWFGAYVATYSRQYRKFTVAHEMFKRYAYRIADSCSSRKTLDKLLKAYKDGPS